MAEVAAGKRIKLVALNEPCTDIEWYPSMLALPAARDIILQIMRRVHAFPLPPYRHAHTRWRAGSAAQRRGFAHAQHYPLKIH